MREGIACGVEEDEKGGGGRGEKYENGLVVRMNSIVEREGNGSLGRGKVR